MKAMILTAGLGTRLRPLTLELAKPAVPVCGKPLILRTVEFLSAQGFSSFRLNLNWSPETVRSVFQNSAETDHKVTFSYEPEILGTAGGLKANESFFDSDCFLMVNGDILFDFRLEQAIDFHKKRKALATLLLLPQQAPFQFTPVRMDEHHNIVSFRKQTVHQEAGPKAFLFTGIHVLSPRIFRYIEPGKFFEIISQAYVSALEAGEKVLGFPSDGYWNDLGDPQRYIQAVGDVLDGKLNSPVTPSYVAQGSTVHRDTELHRVSIERGCVVEQGCSITDSVIWSNVKISQGSIIENCIIGDGVRVSGQHSCEVITLNGSVSFKCQA